jgi:hypothetical protein
MTAMSEAEIWKMVVLGQPRQEKKKKSSQGKKKKAMYSGMPYHSSDYGKCKIGGLWSRLIQAKKQDPISKTTEQKGLKV